MSGSAHEAVVVYGTRYGSTQRYAESLARSLGADLVPVERADASTLDGRRVVVLMSPTLAGTFKVTKFAKRHRAQLRAARTALVVVGLSPVDDAGRAAAVDRAFPGHKSDGWGVFHLLGAISYGQLRPHHRLMMRFPDSDLRKRAKAEPTPENIAAAELAGRDRDEVDLDTLAPVIAWAREAQ